MTFAFGVAARTTSGNSQHHLRARRTAGQHDAVGVRRDFDGLVRKQAVELLLERGDQVALRRRRTADAVLSPHRIRLMVPAALAVDEDLARPDHGRIRDLWIGNRNPGDVEIGSTRWSSVRP